MLIKTILNKVEKFKSFVYRTAILGEQGLVTEESDYSTGRRDVGPVVNEKRGLLRRV